MKIFKSTYNNLIFYTVLLTVIGLAAFVFFPAWHPFKFHVIISDSMAPTVHKNALVMVNTNVRHESLSAGDIISFKASVPDSTEQGTTLHAIYDVNTDANGQLVFRTVTHTSREPDIWTVQKEDIVGQYAVHIEGVGLIYLFLRSPLGIFVSILNAVGLMLLIMFIKSTQISPLENKPDFDKRPILNIFNALVERRPEERHHARRVAMYAKALGEALNLSLEELRVLELVAEVHDIGKITIPDAILHKKGSLTEDEWTTMRVHATVGYNILLAADQSTELAKIAKHHHERFDGTGYPEGLKGEAIPLFSRIITIADSFEAMTADRPYRKALTYETAYEELIKHAGTQFDPQLVDLFIQEVLPTQLSVELVPTFTPAT